MTFSPAKPEIVFVVAIADNGVIGQGNAMPWHLRSDLQRFRAMTWGLPLVMGRKTFQSIGKALPGRTNIVVTRDANFRASGAVVAHTLEQAMNLARGDTLRRGASAMAVIGGGDLFAQLMDRADRLEITEIHAEPEGETLFPSFVKSAWNEVHRERHDPGPHDSAAYSFVTLRRKAAGGPH